MSHDTKISKLKAALEAGERFTPAQAGRRFRFQHNTFHRLLNILKKNHGFIIGRQEYRTKRGRYSVYWLEARPNND